jgi:short-subunit dehydrogenase
MARRLALVTGASAGIGRAFAERYAAEGCDLAVTARRADRLEVIAREVAASHNVEVECICADLADPASPQTILKALSRPPDILVNNAGYGIRGGFAGPAWEQHRAFLEVMVTAPLALAHLCLPHMTGQGWGRIVNVASVAGLVPTTPGQPLYGAAKAFMIKASLGLHLETRDRGVHVTALCPGFTRTEFHDVAGMTEALKPMPGWMWMSAEDVAGAGYRAAEANRPLSVPGLPNKALVELAKLIPESLGVELMAKLRKHG